MSGDAHRARPERMLEMKNKPKEMTVTLSPSDMTLMFQLDLALHMLGGLEAQLGNALKMVDAAAAVRQAANHLAAYKNRHLEGLSKRVVLATAGDVPKVAG